MLNTVKTFVDKHHMIQKKDKILLAVSGGPDSMALLHIMEGFKKDWEIEIGVAHLNHQLRPAAEAEMQYVKSYCSTQGIEFYCRTVDIADHARREKKTIEEAGRDQRYQFFKELCCQFGWQKVATGHHKDDRAETVLMNLLRGSGVKGLRSIMPISGSIIRPLLAVSKSEILAYLDLNAVKYFIDDSNTDLNYLRNRIRYELLPLLKNYNPQIISGLNQLADIAEAEDLVLEEETETKWAQLIISEEADRIVLDNNKLQALMRAYKRRIVQKALAKLHNQTGWSLHDVDYVLDLSSKAGPAKRINLPKGIIVSKQYEKLVFSTSQTEYKSFVYEISLPGYVRIEETGEIFSFKIVPRKNFQIADGETYLDYDKLERPLFLRSRRDGDRFEPSHMMGSKKLKDFFIDIKLPAAERNKVPVLASRQQIYALLGYRLSRNVLVDAHTLNILVVKKERTQEIDSGSTKAASVEKDNPLC